MNSRLHRSLKWLTASLGAATFAIMMFAFQTPSDTMEGRLLPTHMRPELEQQWVNIREDEIRKGVSIPAHRHVLIHLPEEIETITRRTLFGRKHIRYWGYCLPSSYEQAQNLRRQQGFPGTLFLSEKEREIRDAAKKAKRHRSFSIFNNLNDEDLHRTRESRGAIRHQLEIFEGGKKCYVMTEEPLPIGTDADNDGVNAAIERDFGSDPENRDTDADGIIDGIEIFRLGTHPTRRDTDGDGLLDGLEDKNHNGSIEADETDPLQLDTDRDGLCDGLCKVNRGRELRGEDKNLNGEVDEGEYDPKKRDTDGDEILDEQEYLNCIAADGADC